MEHFKSFLDTSTIHGLSWISSTNRTSRLFWILVVITGFSGAGYLIHESFYNWDQSPITTTIETQPISKITFPNVTVCPPKNSFLDLNHDFIKSENRTLDIETRKDLYKFAIGILQDTYFSEMMKNLSKVNDPDRNYNWYYGYTKIRYPCYLDLDGQLMYHISSSALTGNISTPDFEKNFDAEKIDGYIKIYVEMYIHKSLAFTSYQYGRKNTSLLIAIDKKTIKEFSFDDEIRTSISGVALDGDTTYYTENMTNIESQTHSESKSVWLDRKIPKEEINNLKLQKMPGFRLTWYYDGKRNLDNWPKFAKKSDFYYTLYKSFVRYF